MHSRTAFARVLGQDADTLHAAPVTTSVRRVDEVHGLGISG